MTASPLFPWLRRRAAGILAHPTVLPGPHGIGTFGAGARALLGWMEEAGLTVWQVCPLGPTGYGDSPYQSFSAFAGNPYLIDLEPLLEAGLLHPGDVGPLNELPEGRVDYGAQWERRLPILREAFRRTSAGNPFESRYGTVREFLLQHEDWLRPYALFRALKEKHGGAPWYDWPPEERSFPDAVSGGHEAEESEAFHFEVFLQYLFDGQWRDLREEATHRGIAIVGDLPIFVAADSADVWQNPGEFLLDDDLQPTHVAGVPPDYFSETGQLWGNPLYRWEAMEANGFAWWMRRFAANFRTFDVVRIDHFRGFEACYAIPAGSPDATRGAWMEGPGGTLFEQLARKYPDARIILEDLGVITAEVRKLKNRLGCPGTLVHHFGFDGEGNEFTPHNHVRNAALYTGTHDNDTTLGWYASLDGKDQDFVRRYLRVPGDAIGWDLIRNGFESPARLFLAPLQDFLSLGPEARFNTPGTTGDNWSWRCTWGQFNHLREGSTAYLRELATLYERPGLDAEPPADDE